jgi:hypothetical protein
MRVAAHLREVGNRVQQTDIFCTAYSRFDLQIILANSLYDRSMPPNAGRPLQMRVVTPMRGAVGDSDKEVLIKQKFMLILKMLNNLWELNGKASSGLSDQPFRRCAS